MIRLQPRHFVAAATLPTLGFIAMSMCGVCPGKQEVQTKRFCKIRVVEKTQTKKVAHKRRVIKASHNTVWRWENRWGAHADSLYLTGGASDSFVSVDFAPAVNAMDKHSKIKALADKLGHYPAIPLIQLVDRKRGTAWGFIPTSLPLAQYKRDHALFPSKASVVQTDDRVFAVYYNPKHSGGALYALDRASGAVMWRLAFKGHQRQQMRAHQMKLTRTDDGHLMLYVKEEQGGYVQRVHTKTGELLKRRRVSDDATSMTWAPINESTSVPSAPMMFRHNKKWTWRMAYTNRSNVVEQGDHLYVTNYGASLKEVVMYAFDKDSGDVIWARAPQKARFLAKPSGMRVDVDGEFLKVYTESSFFRTIEVLNRKTGQPLSVVTLRR